MTANANGVRDAAGNQSSFAATAPADKAAPVITTLALTDANGQIAGGDTVAVTFSESLSVASLCSTWSGDTANQSLSSNGDVTVTATDSGSSDLLTVSSGTCTLRSGQLNLGANYVTGGNVTFSGNGEQQVDVAWTFASRSLTITLGSSSGAGTRVQVSQPAPSPTRRLRASPTRPATGWARAA